MMLYFFASKFIKTFILEAKLYAGSMHQDATQSHGFDSRIFMVKTGLQFQIHTWKLQSSKTWLTNAKSVHKTGFLGSKDDVRFACSHFQMIVYP